MPIGSIIPWSDFTQETNEYDSTLSMPIRNAGVSPTQYATFSIDPLVEYLNGLKAKGNTEINIHMSVTNVGGMNKLSVIFTADGANEQNPKSTDAYDLGALNP